MERLRTGMDWLLERSLIVIMAMLTLDVLWQVAARYLLAQPSSWTEELARFLLIWVSLLGTAYLTGRQEHIAIDLLSERIDAAARQRVFRFVQVSILVFAVVVLVLGGLNLITITLSLGQSSPALGIPLGYVYLVVPLSGILIVLYSIANLLSAPELA